MPGCWAGAKPRRRLIGRMVYEPGQTLKAETGPTRSTSTDPDTVFEGKLPVRILVLQEIEGNADKIKDCLQSPSNQITVFHSQPEAMQFLNSSQVDLIITAVHLQSGNVFDFLKWVKGDPINRDAKFVFFCAEPTEVARYVWPAVQTAAITLGADKYIAMECFDENKLRSELEEVLARNKPSHPTHNGSAQHKHNGDHKQPGENGGDGRADGHSSDHNQGEARPAFKLVSNDGHHR